MSTPVPSGGSTALKLLVLSVVTSYAFGLAYEHAAAYYLELSKTNDLLVWNKFPMPLLNLVPSLVWTVGRAIAFVSLGVYVAFHVVLGSFAASYDRLMEGNRFDIDSEPELAPNNLWQCLGSRVSPHRTSPPRLGIGRI